MYCLGGVRLRAAYHVVGPDLSKQATRDPGECLIAGDVTRSAAVHRYLVPKVVPSTRRTAT
ncbi:hypothetical protein [Mycobacterium sp. NPDC006124]|uniref:hypothetical protein n=1 Tax=Mycobacterium sp. NPDC006124 TaxID=3156729 RepID=UPI0033AE9941